MHEVKVYNSAGVLKKIISEKKLILRSQKLLETPSIFKRKKRTGRSWLKPVKNPE